MNSVILQSICEYLKEADTKYTTKDSWLVHPKFHNSAGVGTKAWVAIIRPRNYIEMEICDGLVVLEFRNWVNITPYELDWMNARAARGIRSWNEKYSRPAVEYVCRCEKCVAAYSYPYAMQEVEETESFDLADPDSLPAIWRSVVAYRPYYSRVL